MRARADRPTSNAIALSVAKIILHLGGGGGLVSAGEEAQRLLSGLASDTRSPDEVLWRRAFSFALADALRSARVHVQQSETELTKAIGEELGEALQPDVDFGANELIEPTTYAAYPPVRERFPAFVRRIDPEFDAAAGADRLREHLDTALGRGLRRAWSDDVERFQPIVDRLQGPIAEGARRQAAWMRHYAWVRSQFEDAPVFSPEKRDEGIKLAHVYVPLRCVHHEEIEDETDGRRERSFERKKRRAHVGWLHESLHGWLDADDVEDRIRIVAGGPGSGKSSVAKAFAREVILDTGWRVVFVELQLLRLRGDLRDDLARYFDHRRASGAGFPDDPLSWYADGGGPCLLVFDGLDELARSEAGNTDLTRRFVANLKWMLRQCTGDRSLKAVVLGRSAAAQEGCANAELDLRSILHVLPLRPPTRRDLLLGGDGDAKAEKDVLDAEDLLTRDPDQRPLYWRKWQMVRGDPSEPVPEGLTHKDLSELNAEPLLLHLLIISGRLAPNRWREAVENRNCVYEDIFNKVYERDREADKWQVAQLNADDFFTLMECLGLATWAGGGRTGSDEEFKRLRDIHSTGSQERKFTALDNADLESVAVQFYARRDLDEPGYQFIHKSFGEYLIARALLRAAHRARDDLDREGEAEAARKWLRVASLAEITHEILRFLRDEARVRFERVDDARDLKNGSQALMNWTLRVGMPTHREDSGAAFRVIEAKQANAEGALLAVLNACARKVAVEGTAGAAIALDWPQPLALLQLLQRLRRGRDTFPLALAFDHLAWRRSGDQPENDPATIHQKLSKADLSFVSLVDAFLVDAFLVDAFLVGANLRDANLESVNLRDAILERASLGADLGGADLGGADLRRASLGGANLRDANLELANLRDAFLRGADLRRANLRGANLGECRHLTQAQINTALGDENARLPNGLRRPDHWEAK